MGSKRKQHQAPATGGAATHRDVDVNELRAVLERARVALSAEDHALLTGAVDTFTALTRELQLKGVTLERLRRVFLGVNSEKTKKVLGDDEKKEKDTEKNEGEPVVPSKGEDPRKRKGTGETAPRRTPGRSERRWRTRRCTAVTLARSARRARCTP